MKTSQKTLGVALLAAMMAVSMVTTAQANPKAANKANKEGDSVRCEKLESKEDWASAGACFERSYLKDKKGRNADKLLIRAAVNFERASLLSRGIELRKELIQRLPDSNMVADALFGICSSYDAMEHRNGAVTYCTRFVNFFPEHVDAPEAAELARKWEQPVEADDKDLREL